MGPEADVVDLEHPETPCLGTTPFPKCEKLETHCSRTSTRSHDSHPAHVSPQPFLRAMAFSLLLSSAFSCPPFLSLKPHLLRPPGFASSFPNLRKSFHQVKSLNSVWFPTKHRKILQLFGSVDPMAVLREKKKLKLSFFPFSFYFSRNY